MWIGLVSSVENGIAIIAGSLVTLRPLFRHLSRRFTSARGSSASTRTPAGPRTPRPPKKATISSLDDSTAQMSGSTNFTGKDTMSTFKSMDLSVVPEDQVGTLASQRSTRPGWLRRPWWSPPKFKAGLMTEFNGALDEEKQVSRKAPRQWDSLREDD